MTDSNRKLPGTGDNERCLRIKDSLHKRDPRHHFANRPGSDSWVRTHDSPATFLGHGGAAAVRHFLTAIFLRLSHRLVGHEAGDLRRKTPDHCYSHDQGSERPQHRQSIHEEPLERHVVAGFGRRSGAYGDKYRWQPNPLGLAHAGSNGAGHDVTTGLIRPDAGKKLSRKEDAVDALPNRPAVAHH